MSKEMEFSQSNAISFAELIETAMSAANKAAIERARIIDRNIDLGTIIFDPIWVGIWIDPRRPNPDLPIEIGPGRK